MFREAPDSTSTLRLFILVCADRGSSLCWAVPAVAAFSTTRPYGSAWIAGYTS